MASELGMRIVWVGVVIRVRECGGLGCRVEVGVRIRVRELGLELRFRRVGIHGRQGWH